jgi:uncharacterized protein (DUF1499 family)
MSIADTAMLKPLLEPARWPAALVRFAMVASIVGLVLLLAAGPGYRLRLVPLIPALLGAALGFVLFVLAFLSGAIGWLRARGGRPLPRGTAVLLVFAGIVSAFGIVFMVHASGAPPIHDITTDFDDPPAFAAVLAARTASGALNPADYRRLQETGGERLDVAAAQRSAYPDILPIETSQAPATLMPLAVKAAHDMGWDVVATDPADGRLEATDTTRYFGFKDDIVVRIRAMPSGSRIDVRSESRVGRGDAGANAHRLAKYLAALRLIAHAPAAP